MSRIPWWIKYPYVNDEIQNLDWLLKQINENTEKLENFINLNTIKYADPILWDITSQYEANTIVVDPQTGDAYLSVTPVPYGVSLGNTDYWTKIYHYDDAINNLEEQIAIANEKLSTTASEARSIEDLVWLHGDLYEIIAPMNPGDLYVENTNCIKTTIEEYVNTRFTEIRQNLNDEITTRENADTEFNDILSNQDISLASNESSIHVAFSGDDTEGDGTAGNPVKTILKAIEIGSKVKKDVRVYIDEAGTYPLGFKTVSCNLHLVSTVDNVTVQLTEDCRFYANHVSIFSDSTNNLTLDCGAYTLYTDGHILFSKCTIKGTIQGAGSDMRLNNCTLDTISISNEFLYLNNCTITEPDASTAGTAIYAVNSHVYITGTFTVDISADVDRYLFYISASFLQASQSIVNTSSNKFTKCYLSWCTFVTNSTTINAIVNNLVQNITRNNNVYNYIEFNVAPAVNATNIDSPNSIYEITKTADNRFKMNLHFKFNNTPGGSYTYNTQTINGTKIVGFFNTSGNFFDISDLQVFHFGGNATIQYEDLNGNYVTENVPLVTVASTSTYFITGILFDVSVCKNIISVGANLITQFTKTI